MRRRWSLAAWRTCSCGWLISGSISGHADVDALPGNDYCAATTDSPVDPDCFGCGLGGAAVLAGGAGRHGCGGRMPSCEVGGGTRRGDIRMVYSRCRLARMSVPLTLRGLLERQPSHGYDLKRDYDNYFGRVRPLPFGQVYSTLGRLARDGKVVIGEVGPGEGPDRKPYVITDQGAT